MKKAQVNPDVNSDVKKKKTNKEKVNPLSESIKSAIKTSKLQKKEDEIEIKIKKNDIYTLPKYAHDGDVGMDVIATGMEYLEDIDTYVYFTGLHVESDKNIGCFLLPRSSNRRTDVYMPNSPGLADTFTYRGELCFSFKNRTDIDVIAAIAAINKIGNAKWWKRPFMNFTDEWRKSIETLKKEPQHFAPYEVGDKIGQLVFFKHPTVKFKEVEELSKTERGKNGFGSTGK
jgi:dUTP pyrophosphatase